MPDGVPGPDVAGGAATPGAPTVTSMPMADEHHQQPTDADLRGRRAPTRRVVRRTTTSVQKLLPFASFALFAYLFWFRKGDAPGQSHQIWTITIVVLGLIGMIAGLRYRIGRGKRRRVLAEWAVAHGGAIAPRPVHPRSASPVVTGALTIARAGNPERPRITDWVWARPGGRFAEAFCFSSKKKPAVQYVAIGAPALPRIVLDCRDDDALWQLKGQQFEAESFNHSWSVRAADRRYASAVVHPRMMQLLENSPRHVESLVLEDGLLVSICPVYLDAEALAEHIATLERLVSLIEPFVINSYRTR